MRHMQRSTEKLENVTFSANLGLDNFSTVRKLANLLRTLGKGGGCMQEVCNIWLHKFGISPICQLVNSLTVCAVFAAVFLTVFEPVFLFVS